MRQFLQKHKLYITPLSPIHIGSGVDIDPTSYVIEGDFLYGFNPASGILNYRQRADLARLAKRGDLLGIQRFFKKNSDRFIPFSEYILPVCRGLKNEYKNTLGSVRHSTSNGNDVFNQFFISRHITGGVQAVPYVPGSSLKGAARTAWINPILEQEPRTIKVDNTPAIDSFALQGNFDRSPFRLLKISDLMPKGRALSDVLYSVVWFKKALPDRKQNTSISTRVECLSLGQYRAFGGTVTLPSILPQEARRARRLNRSTRVPESLFLNDEGFFDLSLLAQRCNPFYYRLLLEELEFLETTEGQGDRSWCKQIRHLFSPESTLYKKLARNKAFLIRLGANTGKESSIYSANALENILIRKRGKYKKPENKTPKTKTLAASNHSAQEGFLPFGWAVVEIDPNDECQTLRTWCEAVTISGYAVDELKIKLNKEEENRIKEKDNLQTLVLSENKALQKAQEQAQLEAEKKKQEEKKRAKKEAERLAAMTKNELKIESFKQACQDWAAQLPPHGNFRKQRPNPGEEGLYQDARLLINQALAGEDWSQEEKEQLVDTIEKWLPKVISPWNARSERRRLKLNRLRGK